MGRRRSNASGLSSSPTSEERDKDSKYDEKYDCFYAILRSALGACNMPMLNHRSRTGYRIVDRIVVLKDTLGTGIFKGRSFMIVLSERRKRPSKMAKPSA